MVVPSRKNFSWGSPLLLQGEDLDEPSGHKWQSAVVSIWNNYEDLNLADSEEKICWIFRFLKLMYTVMTLVNYLSSHSVQLGMIYVWGNNSGKTNEKP